MQCVIISFSNSIVLKLTTKPRKLSRFILDRRGSGDKYLEGIAPFHSREIDAPHRRVASAESGRIYAPSDVWYGEGCPLFSNLTGLGSIKSSPSGWKRILAYFDGHRTLFLPIYADAYSSLNCFMSQNADLPICADAFSSSNCLMSQNARFANICWCFHFIKLFNVMSHSGATLMLGKGQLPPSPT